jgi:L-lactate utilization protein LutC
MKFDKIPTEEIIGKTAHALQENGFTVEVVSTGIEAKEKVLSLIPKNSEVFTATSVTLQTTEIDKAINESHDYQAVRDKLFSESVDKREKKRLGAAPEYVIGSIHALTTDGKVLIASNTGSQLPSYVYGADHVIWVVGAQKIVKNLDEGFQRIYDYVLPLESERAHKAYGVAGSFVSKLLIINKEVAPKRITIIIVKEKLGF